MTPMDFWRNSTPFFGVSAFCTTKICDFRSWLIWSFCTLVFVCFIKIWCGECFRCGDIFILDCPLKSQIFVVKKKWDRMLPVVHKCSLATCTTKGDILWRCTIFENNRKSHMLVQTVSVYVIYLVETTRLYRMTYNIVRLVLIAPINYWQNHIDVSFHFRLPTISPWQVIRVASHELLKSCQR